MLLEFLILCSIGIIQRTQQFHNQHNQEQMDMDLVVCKRDVKGSLCNPRNVVSICEKSLPVNGEHICNGLFYIQNKTTFWMAVKG